MENKNINTLVTINKEASEALLNTAHTNAVSRIMAFMNNNTIVAQNTVADGHGNTVDSFELIRADGTQAHITNKDSASRISETVYLFNFGDALESAKYSALAEMELSKDYASMGYKDIRSFVRENLQCKVDSAMEMLSVFKRFYTRSESGAWGTRVELEPVNLSNLKVLSGVLSKECENNMDKLVELINNGTIHPLLPQTALKKEIQEMRNTIPEQVTEQVAEPSTEEQTKDAEQPFGNTEQATEQSTPEMTPQEKAYYYGEMFSQAIVASLDDSKAKKAIKLYNEIMKLFA